jgi:hypothetical protein
MVAFSQSAKVLPAKAIITLVLPAKVAIARVSFSL